MASLSVTGCGGGSSSSSGNGDTALANAESNGESSGEVCSDVETLSSGNYDSVIAKWKTLDQIERRGLPEWSLLAALVFVIGGLYFPIFLNGTLFREVLEVH